MKTCPHCGEAIDDAALANMREADLSLVRPAECRPVGVTSVSDAVERVEGEALKIALEALEEIAGSQPDDEVDWDTRIRSWGVQDECASDALERINALLQEADSGSDS